MLRRRSSTFLVSAVALVAASGTACTTVLGLLQPTLDPCENGCPDVSAPTTDASGSSSGGDSTASGDDAPDAALPDAMLDVTPDVAPDRGPSSGTRCGPPGPGVFFCAAPEVCCLTLDDAGTPSYACATSASACGDYPIACATNNDCPGMDICCFYNSGIKCEPQSTGSCANVLVCDPGGPADQCPAHETCTIAYIENGYTLPYDGCH